MDTHGMKFVVDTTGVAKGFRDYKSAVEGIFASLDKFEAHVDKTMRGVAKAASNPQALNAFKKAVSAFAKVDIDTSAARKLSALSSAMSGFKAPSPQQTANTRKFFTTLSGSMPDLTAAYRSIKAINDLKSAMGGFKAPPASASKNLTAFASAMQTAAPAFASMRRIAGVSGVANELATISVAMRNLKAPSAGQVTNIGNLALAMRAFNFSNLAGSQNLFSALSAISHFKAPSTAQIKNLQQFVHAVATMRVPPNADAVASALTKIANAASFAGSSLTRFRGGLGSLGGPLAHVGSQARGASLQMMGLQNSFSATFQAGSLLRSLLGSLTIAEVGRNFFKATNAAIAFKAQMGILSKELGFANTQLDYINTTSNRFGIDAIGAAAGFGRVSIAAHKSGMSVMETRHIFEGLSSAMTVLGTTTDGQQDVWLALQQVMNKGYLSAEELNQQLNEKLPGAMAYAGEYAESLGMTLEKGLKTKALDAAGVLEHIATRMKEDFGPAVADALNRPAAQMNILKNNFNMLFQAIGEAGGNEAFANLLKTINEKMKPDAIARYAEVIGGKLKNAVDKITKAFTYLYDNWDSIKGPLSTTLSLIGKFMVVSGALQIGRFLVSPLISAGRAALYAAPLLWQMVYATRALTASNLTGYYTQLARISDPRIVAGTTAVANGLARLSGAAAGGGAAASGLGRITTLAKGATGAVAGLAAAIGVGLTAAWGIATQAAYDSTGQTVSINYSAGEIITGIWLTMTEGLAEKWDKAMTYVDNMAKWLGDQLNIKITGIGSMFAKLGFGIWYSITKAFEAVMRAAGGFAIGMYRTISSIGGALGDLLTGDFTGAAARAKGALLGEDMMSGFQSAFSGMEFGSADFNREYAQLGSGAGVVADWLNDMGERGRGKPDRPATPRVRETMTDAEIAAILGEPRSTRPPGGDSDGKGKKPKTFEQLANEAETAVDAMMKKLSDHDPIGKLYTDFVRTLTDNAHTLLNDDGYRQFLANITEDAKDGQVTVQSLIDTLQNSGNLSAATFDDLKARYGEDVSGIIDMLRAQQAAYEDSVKETTIKGLDRRFKAITAAMEALGDTLPILAQAKGDIDTLTKLGRMAMPAGEGFTQWLTDLRSGATTAEEAMERLAAVMADPNQRSADFSQFLGATGTNPQEVIDASRRELAARAESTRQAQIDLQFGERLLQSRHEEILLLSMSAREAEAYTTVQEEVNRAKAAGVAVTQEMITSLMGEVQAQQNLADQMQRNRDFFENNGVRSYLNDLTDVGTAINDLDKNFLQSLEDQLFSLGTTGTFSFKAIFDTIQQGLIRFASQGIMETLTSKLFSAGELDGGTPSIFGSLFKLFGQSHAPSQTNPLGSAINPMYVQFATGVGIDAFTGNLFKDKGTVTLIDDMGSQAAASLTNAVDTAGNVITTDWAANMRNTGGILQQMISSIAGGAGGGGGGLGGLLQMGLSIGMAALGGGVGPSAALVPDVMANIAANPGIFKEGGMSSSPVARMSIHPSAFLNAPHYAQGTPNTSGGHPAMLHDNEAVIPLTRGRKVAVELGDGARNGQVINQHFTFPNANVEGFKKSKQQVATDMHMQAGRAFRRNHG